MSIVLFVLDTRELVAPVLLGPPSWRRPVAAGEYTAPLRPSLTMPRRKLGVAFVRTVKTNMSCALPAPVAPLSVVVRTGIVVWLVFGYGSPVGSSTDE